MPPRAVPVSIEARIEPLTGALPSIAWRWDPETDILSGASRATGRAGGLTGTVELTDAEGSVAVLDVNNGVICGLDVVVWPEVTTAADLQVPARLTDGRVVLPSAPPAPGSPRSRWIPRSRSRPTAPRACFTCGSAPGRAVEVVRVADNFYVEVDQQGGLAGFWLDQRAAVHGVRGRDVARSRGRTSP